MLGNNSQAGQEVWPGHGYKIIIVLSALVISCSLGSIRQQTPANTPTPVATATSPALVINLEATINIPTIRPTDMPPPTNTPRPTDTPSPTNTPRPIEPLPPTDIPTPTPEPATATPAPPQIPPDVRLYGEAVGAIMADFSREMNNLSQLLVSGRVENGDWLPKLKDQAVIVRLLRAELTLLTPPAEVLDIHQALLTATNDCKRAADLLTDNNDENALADLTPILAQVAACAQKLAAVTELEQAYLVRLGTGEPETPTATPETE